MQELEKILEEIDAHAIEFETFGISDDYISVGWVKEIIRNHMNDGWVSVEERVPKEEGYKVLVCSKKGNIDTGIYSPYTKQWFIGNISALCKDIIAWRPLPEPYRPERVEQVTEHKRLTTKEKYPHGAEGVSKDKLTGKYCRGVFEATACVEKLAEYETAEEEGRLVVLPVGIGDEVYIIEKCSNIPERLDGTLYDSDGGPGTATGYYCPYEENCPFDGDDFTICDDYKEKLAIFKDYVNEIHIRENEVFIFAENTCQYCSFGKTMFLTREEAEKALKEMKIK